MSSYDDLDREIDREMGWDKGGKPANNSIRRRPDYWQALLRTARVSSPLFRPVKAAARAFAKVAFFPVVSPLGYAKHFNVHGDMVIVKRSAPWRVLDAVLTRLLLTPVILAVFFIGVVYASTHPKPLQAFSTPDGFGMYFKRINLVSVDNQRLTAWYIPPINADEVAFDPEGTLLQRWPAVVLCHGLGGTHDEYLPLAKSLHAAGFGVLMLDTRGQGESDPAAVTYGLRERLDVLAGVKFLRENTYIDPGKVCVVGHDIGAMAVLQAAALDSSIAAVVADGLWPRFEDRARTIFSRPTQAHGGSLPTQWLAPLYTVAFEIAVRDRLNQLDPETVVRSIHTQPVLFVARSGPDYAPVQDVLTLATNAGSRHEVIPATGDWESRLRVFLIKATNWKGPKARGAEQIENLLKNSVSK
jgi:pimeloyl-ACP methyl ester carboxylesterase